MSKTSNSISLVITSVLITIGVCSIWYKHITEEAFHDACKGRGGLVVKIDEKPHCFDKENFQNVREK